MDRIQLRRDSLQRWTQENPILLEGEIGLVLDTMSFKIGDGIHNWSQLDYSSDPTILQDLGDSQSAIISQRGTTQQIKLETSYLNSVSRTLKFFNEFIELNNDGTAKPIAPSDTYKIAYIALKGDEVQFSTTVPCSYNWYRTDTSPSSFISRTYDGKVVAGAQFVLLQFNGVDQPNYKQTVIKHQVSPVLLSELTSNTVESEAKFDAIAYDYNSQSPHPMFKDIVVTDNAGAFVAISPSTAYKNALVKISTGVTKYSVRTNNGYPVSYHWFTSATLNAESWISRDTEGIVPNGAKVVLIQFNNAPSGLTATDYSTVEIYSERTLTPVNILTPQSQSFKQGEFAPESGRGMYNSNQITDGSQYPGIYYDFPIPMWATKVRYQMVSSAGVWGCCFLDYNKNWISGYLNSDLTLMGEYNILDIPLRAKYFRFTYYALSQTADGSYPPFDKVIFGNTAEDFSTYIDTEYKGQVQNLNFSDAEVVMTATETPSSNQNTQTGVFDDLFLGHGTTVKVNNNMYYMYYTCYGTDSRGKGKGELLAFAYSVDGRNWTKSYPPNVTHEVLLDDGTVMTDSNIIFLGGVKEHDVVLVNDPEYPFRLIANKSVMQDTYTNMTYICMWKSKDGVNFIDEKIVVQNKFDSQPSVIVKDNILKVYHRMRNWYISARCIGVMYLDLGGNIVSPLTKLSNTLYYNSAAIQIDDHRELLLPTYYNEQEVLKNHYESIIVDGTNISKANSNIESLKDGGESWVKGNDGWGWFMPHQIWVDEVPYALYVVRNFPHDYPQGFPPADRETIKKTEIRMAKITWDTVGKPCPATPV